MISKPYNNFCLQRSSKVHLFDINAESEDLRQQSGETLSVYYKWVESMMECVGVKDRPDIGIPVTPLEMAFLDSVIRSFIKSISDFDINKDIATC